MTNFTETNIRSEAARIGFFKKSIIELSGIVKNNVNDSFIKDEKILQIEIANCQQKSIDRKDQIESLELKYKNNPFNSKEFSISILGISLISVLIHSGNYVSGIFGPLLIGLGFIGSLIMTIHEMKNPVWRPILFTTLSILGGAIIFTALRESDKGFALSVITGLVTGLNIYILNSTIITSIQYFIKHMKSIIITVRTYFNDVRLRYWTMKEKKANQRLDTLDNDRKIAFNKMNNLIELDYMIGETAREIKGKTTKNNILYRPNKKEYTYAS